MALWAYIFLRLGVNNDNLYSHPPSQISPSPISPSLVLPLQTLRLLSLVSLMTKTKRIIVDNLFRWFQNSGTKSRGDFTFCTAAAILRCTFCPALLPKCGTMWKTTWRHNVDNIRQKDIKVSKYPSQVKKIFVSDKHWFALRTVNANKLNRTRSCHGFNSVNVAVAMGNRVQADS